MTTATVRFRDVPGTVAKWLPVTGFIWTGVLYYLFAFALYRRHPAPTDGGFGFWVLSFEYSRKGAEEWTRAERRRELGIYVGLVLCVRSIVKVSTGRDDGCI